MFKFISLDKERPFHGEKVLVANKEWIAMCIAFIHGSHCPPDCQDETGHISFYSQENETKTLRNPTHFARVRNPNEPLQ